MNFTQQQAIDYDRDGYILVPDLFTPAEIAALVRDVEKGSRVADSTGDRTDGAGKSSKYGLWADISDDIWGAASTSPRIVNNIRILMREDIAFFHGKVMMKEAKSGGAWEWHQDYGYWHELGLVFPHMMSAFVALDAATVENGCLQVLRGSHKMGRLTHIPVGSQTGVDPERIKAIEPLFERVQCEMKAGSVLFFHCNLLHSSQSNESDHHRRSFIMCYNALANAQVGVPNVNISTRSCPVSSDDAIMQFA